MNAYFLDKIYLKAPKYIVHDFRKTEWKPEEEKEAVIKAATHLLPRDWQDTVKLDVVGTIKRDRVRRPVISLKQQQGPDTAHRPMSRTLSNASGTLYNSGAVSSSSWTEVGSISDCNWPSASGDSRPQSPSADSEQGFPNEVAVSLRLNEEAYGYWAAQPPHHLRSTDDKGLEYHFQSAPDLRHSNSVMFQVATELDISDAKVEIIEFWTFRKGNRLAPGSGAKGYEILIERGSFGILIDAETAEIRSALHLFYPAAAHLDLKAIVCEARFKEDPSKGGRDGDPWREQWHYFTFLGYVHFPKKEKVPRAVFGCPLVYKFSIMDMFLRSKLDGVFDASGIYNKDKREEVLFPA